LLLGAAVLAIATLVFFTWKRPTSSAIEIKLSPSANPLIFDVRAHRVSRISSLSIWCDSAKELVWSLDFSPTTTALTPITFASCPGSARQSFPFEGTAKDLVPGVYGVEVQYLTEKLDPNLGLNWYSRDDSLHVFRHGLYTARRFFMVQSDRTVLSLDGMDSPVPEEVYRQIRIAHGAIPIDPHPHPMPAIWLEYEKAMRAISSVVPQL
jgi:hypothetical protein